MKLFVGSLPWSLTDKDLRELFEEFGEVVSAKIIMDKMTDRSKGFGFVEMKNSDEGNAAMEKLNSSEVQGRTIVVNRAHDNQRSGA